MAAALARVSLVRTGGVRGVQHLLGKFRLQRRRAVRDAAQDVRALGPAGDDPAHEPHLPQARPSTAAPRASCLAWTRRWCRVVLSYLCRSSTGLRCLSQCCANATHFILSPLLVALSCSANIRLQLFDGFGSVVRSWPDLVATILGQNEISGVLSNQTYVRQKLTTHPLPLATSGLCRRAPLFSAPGLLLLGSHRRVVCCRCG